MVIFHHLGYKQTVYYVFLDGVEEKKGYENQVLSYNNDGHLGLAHYTPRNDLI